MNFESMTDTELRQYFLEHRDEESFHAYMDRRYARPNRFCIHPDDPEWESKIRESINRQRSVAGEHEQST